MMQVRVLILYLLMVLLNTFSTAKYLLIDVGDGLLNNTELSTSIFNVEKSPMPGYRTLQNSGCYDHLRMCSQVRKKDCCSELIQENCPVACNTCKVDGGWGRWGQYEQCSTTCGLGQKFRTRKCDNPKPLNGGKYCVGSDRDKTTCYNNQECEGITTIDCNKPYDTEVTKTGIIQSPNYPMKYAPDQDCRITIRFSNRIRLQFLSLDVEYHSDCDHDYIMVYDGPDVRSKMIKKKFCGDKNPPEITSSGNAMHIQFISDATAQKTGFQIKVVAHGSSVCIKERGKCDEKGTCCAGLECNKNARPFYLCMKKAYSLIGKNRLCADEGKGEIAEDDCEKFADEKKLGFKTETHESYPKGCYQYIDRKVYFNRHRVGSKHSKAAPICSGQGSCSDKNKNCNKWEKYCTTSFWMKENCKKTCNYCG